MHEDAPRMSTSMGMGSVVSPGIRATTAKLHVADHLPWLLRASRDFLAARDAQSAVLKWLTPSPLCVSSMEDCEADELVSMGVLHHMPD